jgi:hypothetical protein
VIGEMANNLRQAEKPGIGAPDQINDLFPRVGGYLDSRSRRSYALSNHKTCRRVNQKPELQADHSVHYSEFCQKDLIW